MNGTTTTSAGCVESNAGKERKGKECINLLFPHMNGTTTTSASVLSFNRITLNPPRLQLQCTSCLKSTVTNVYNPSNVQYSNPHFSHNFLIIEI